MKTLVKNTALDLIKKNQVTTTLEVKEELIATQPTYFWKQSFVSDVLSELADESLVDYIDNGNFRIYREHGTPSFSFNSSIVPPASSKYKKVPLSQRNVVKTSLTALAKLVEDNAGKFIGLVHKKRTTGQQNTMNCQVLKGLTPLGQISVKEQGQLKTIYPTDLLEVRLKSTVYQLK